MLDADISSYKIFNDSYADVNDIRLHVVSLGEGKLILFLHGFRDFWAIWKDHLVEFGRDHQAVAVDLPERVNALIREFIAKDIKLTVLTS